MPSGQFASIGEDPIVHRRGLAREASEPGRPKPPFQPLTRNKPAPLFLSERVTTCLLGLNSSRGQRLICKTQKGLALCASARLSLHVGGPFTPDKTIRVPFSYDKLVCKAPVDVVRCK